MTDIALSRDVPVPDLARYLEELLSGVRVYVQPLGSHAYRPCDVFVTTAGNPSEFPCGLIIGVALNDASAIEGWLRELARRLSIQFQCRTVCDGTAYGDDDHPYWSIIWDSGVAYLADDCGTIFADGEGGAVQIVRPLPALGSEARPVDLPGMVRRSSEWDMPLET